MRLVICLAVLLLAGAMASAFAANTAHRALEAQRLTLAGLAEKAEKLSDEIERNAESDARLVEIRLELEDLSRKILEAGVSFGPRLAEINARIEQLGPPPAEGAPPEPEAVAEERAALAQEKAEINVLIGQAENVSIEVNRDIGDIATMRRELFANTLSKRYEINYALFDEVISEAGDETAQLYGRISSSLRFALNFKLAQFLGATFFALLAAVVLMIGGRRLFGRLIVADPANADPSYLSRLSVAFWSTLLPLLAVAVFLGLTHFLYSSYGVLRADLAPVMLRLVQVIQLVYFVHRLAQAALAPSLPNWRLIAVETPAAYMLVWLITLTALIIGFDFLLDSINELLRAPLALTVGKSLVSTVLVGLLVILIGAVKPFAGATADSPRRPWPILLRYILYVLGGVTILAALAGYIGFARFMAQQIVVTGAILATMYIGFQSAAAISEEGAFARSGLGRRLTRSRKIEESTLDQFGLLTSILINILVLCGGLPLILFQWGFQAGDIQTWVYRLATGITVGSITISLVGILTGILVFFAVFFLTRWFQGWLDGKVMARGRVDTGVRTSIRTAVGYAGVAIAALVGVSAAGIDLSSLALIAGGLSLGIGFGLQNIVQNFVSGLILLAERPFKAGDWIVSGSVSGTVKKISVRATEIETFQRQTVILPNSELINSAVGNWTHRNKLGRIEIPVSISYASDPKIAHAVLLDIARSHPSVLRNPEPFVLFSGFAATSINFEIRLVLADILTGSQVQNDIRFAIVERFAEEGLHLVPPAAVTTIKTAEDEPFEIRIARPGDDETSGSVVAEAGYGEPSARKPRIGKSRKT